VNDRTSSRARAELVMLAPELASATHRGPVTSAAVIDAVVTTAARHVDIPEPTLQLRDRAMARAAQPAGRIRRWWRSATACDFTVAAIRSLAALVEQVSRSAGDDASIGLLRSGLDGYGAAMQRIASAHLVAAPLDGAETLQS
jgi:hypothetical protein